MNIFPYFSAYYAEACGKFQNAARGAGAKLESYCNPAPGPDGSVLSTDTARLGPRDAERLLVVMSGTHGVEGFCGSALQTGLLQCGIAARQPDGVALLMIHAINPSGFAWVRRVTEGNVDLNRNFVDHRGPYPANPGYELLRDAISPRDWSPAGCAAADAVLDAYGAEHGVAALNNAIMLGQFVDPDGLMYGGRAPTWSNLTLREILCREAASARQVALLDFHTGLGDYAAAEVINNHLPGHPGFQRVRNWFALKAEPSEAVSIANTAIVGDVTIAFDQAFGPDAVTAVTLEFGTVPLLEVRDALRGDNWLHVHGRLASAEGHEIKARLRQAFYPDRQDWRGAVWEQTVAVFRQASAALAGSGAPPIPASPARKRLAAPYERRRKIG